MGKIAYITSGKIGIPRFTFNELVEIENQGLKFILCLTQLNPGPFEPKKNWDFTVARKSKSLFQLIFLLVSNRSIYPLIVEALRNGVLPYLLIAISFYSSLKRMEISSIHCQMGDKKLFSGYFLKKLLNLPLTATVHAHELYQKDVYDNNKQVRNLYSEVDKVITVSDFNARIIKDKFGVPENKLEVIRLFPEIDHLQCVQKKTKILVVANWAEKKGFRILLEAVKTLNRDDYVVWIIGGTYNSVNSIDLETLVNQAGLNKRVILLGRLGPPMLDIVYSACDLFCLPSITEYDEQGRPSEREGIPVALMEAMAWGKPVISTRHAGIPELVEDILIKENDVDELRSALKYLLDNSGKWKEMGDRNQRIIENNYTRRNVADLIKVLKVE